MKRGKNVGATLGVIGGSGLYHIDELRVLAEVKPRTPFGEPSDAIVIGRIGDVNVAFLPRHGRGHRLLPGEVPSRANMAAFKSLGVRRVLAFSAVGSLKEELAPLDFVVPDQVIDRTRRRDSTFFGDGVVGHVAFADPFSRPMSELLHRRAGELGLRAHRGETLICMEGPMFSTRAESHLYRSWGAGIINMSALPEAKLAREAELEYALVCMVTDYDCWHNSHESVDIQMVIANLNRNAANARRLLVESVAELDALPHDPVCRDAAKTAIITDPKRIPARTLAGLRFLYPDRFGSAPARKAGGKAAKAAGTRGAAKKPASKRAQARPATKKAASPPRRKGR